MAKIIEKGERHILPIGIRVVCNFCATDFLTEGGRHAAVASMKAEATEAVRRILDAGGNAFDAAVAGQAALGVTDFSLNGVGSDAVLKLRYNGDNDKRGTQSACYT